MSLWNMFRRPVAPAEAKASRTGPLIALHSAGRPVWTARDYTALAREGFMRNAVVYRCVRLVAEAAASVPVLLYDRDEELHEHPLLDLLKRPNPRQSQSAFLEALVGHLLVAGNAYVEAAVVDDAVRELHVLRPDRMRLVPGPDGWPEAYDYVVGGQSIRFRQDAEPLPPIMHLALFHPLDDHYGMAPLEAAAVALDTHNTAAGWNKALLDNSARPSGALVYSGPDGAAMTDDQFQRLKGELETQFQGAANAGRPLLLDGGLDWKTMALTPRDMDFVDARNAAAREIALAFGVSPLLLGIPGDNTYSNYQEANRALWRQTVIPLLRRITQDMGDWLKTAFAGENLHLVPDFDGVDALAADREALWKRLDAASFLSDDEKRDAVGYGPREC